MQVSPKAGRARRPMFVFPGLGRNCSTVVAQSSADKRANSPRVLLATSATWLNATRLALSLNEVGFRVEAVCLNRHSLARVEFVDRTYAFNPLRPQASMKAAILQSQPDIIVPCDDQVAGLLHRMSAGVDRQTRDGAAIGSLIARSLGVPETFEVLHSRADIMRIAGEAGLRHPETAPIDDRAALTRWLGDRGFPAVLKTDGSWGGEGVFIVNSLAEALRAFERLRRRPNLFRTAKRLLVKGDSGPLMGLFARRSPVVSVQTFATGRPANAAVVCMNGEVLAAVYAEVIRSKGQTGPATVVRVLEHPEMASSVETMVRTLGLSGFVGFDFVLDPHSGAASLIELNPRATPTCHLVTIDGLDLSAALSASLRQRPRRKPKAARDPRIVALFPQEMLRDPASAFLSGLHHDVPWQSPELVALGMQATVRSLFRPPWFPRANQGSGVSRRSGTPPAANGSFQRAELPLTPFE